MKQGTKVTWVDGMGFEHKGKVDWEATQWTKDPVPIMDKRDGAIKWIERYNLTEARQTNETH